LSALINTLSTYGVVSFLSSPAAERLLDTAAAIDWPPAVGEDL